MWARHVTGRSKVMGNRPILIPIGEVYGVKPPRTMCKLLGRSDPFATRVVGIQRVTTPTCVSRP